MSPSSCRIRRTSLSDTPSASKRASTSRIRRVPHSAFCCLSATTRSRGTDGVGFLPRGPNRLFCSADSPSLRNAVVHFVTAAADTPNAFATSFSLVPRSRSCTTSSLYSGGMSRGAPRLPCFLFAISSPVLLTHVSVLGGTALGDYERLRRSHNWRAAQGRLSVTMPVKSSGTPGPDSVDVPAAEAGRLLLGWSPIAELADFSESPDSAQPIRSATSTAHLPKCFTTLLLLRPLLRARCEANKRHIAVTSGIGCTGELKPLRRSRRG